MAAASTVATSAGRTKTAIPAAIIGTVLEWYDFAVYAYVAAIIAKQFFSKQDPTSGLLSAFAAFGLGFIARPLGGIVIGRMGDVVGRKPALMLTFIFMAIATTAIGLIPGYASLGILAPALLVFLRLVQGFAAGGEWGSSTAFIAEWAPEGHRGFLASLQQTSVVSGLLLGSGVTAALNTILAPSQMESFGWRIPFLLGILLLPVGVYMRQNVGETPAYQERRDETPPTQSLWACAWRAFGFTILWTVAFYILLAYMPTFTQKYGGLTSALSLWSNTIGLLVAAVMIPVMGNLSDRVGRKPLLLTAGLGFLVLSYPFFVVVTTNAGFGVIILIQIAFALLIAFYSGAGPAAIAELFPTLGRSMWMSTSYSLAVAIFGGFAPFIATWLIARTGSPLAPTYYLIAAAIVSTGVFLSLRETAFEKLA